ncbi:FMN-dependent NADH-azoreductase [Rhizobiales bacterium GAS191]|nr:FMN-dependent NADH-azoreductase [Rhizobiales bacterium GAS191]
MANLLVINSSAAREDSISRVLVHEAVLRLMKANPGAVVVRRDFGGDPIPHLAADSLAGGRGVPKTEAELAARFLSDVLIAALRVADIILIGAPMCNFSVPTTLRAWFDYVLRAGETFSYSEAGPKGLLEGRRAIVVESRGGLYSEDPGQASDFQEPYLRRLLGFIGITDVIFIHAEKAAFGPDARAAAIETAKAGITAVAGTPLTRAA